MALANDGAAADVVLADVVLADVQPVLLVGIGDTQRSGEFENQNHDGRCNGGENHDRGDADRLNPGHRKAMVKIGGGEEGDGQRPPDAADAVDGDGANRIIEFSLAVDFQHQ